VRLVEEALELPGGGAGEAAAVLLEVFERLGRLQVEVASRLVPRAWDLCPAPMLVLSRERWVRLFRVAGYTHEFVPAAPPTGVLRLYRGSDERGREGLCWPSNLDVARWLASRYDEGWVWVAVVEPVRLLAFVAAGYEDQFVVDTTGLVAEVLEGPEVVRGLDVDELSLRLDAAAGVDDGLVAR
jgi:hypothetical protein